MASRWSLYVNRTSQIMKEGAVKVRPYSFSPENTVTYPSKSVITISGVDDPSGFPRTQTPLLLQLPEALQQYAKGCDAGIRL